MHPIDAAERRARLASRHRLAPIHKADDPLQVARDLVAIHSTDAPSVYLAALARMKRGSLEAVERALYDERCLVRVMGMRRTVFAVSRELVPVVIAACGRAVGARERRTLLAMLAESGLAETDESWLEEAEASALKALALLGEAKAAELAACDPRLGASIVLNEGKPYEARLKVASRVLTLLAAEGRMVRARPVGSWRSSQYRWSLMETWMGEPLAEWTAERAQAELARRWLSTFGPATVEDFRWWSGLTLGAVKKAFSQLSLAEVDLGGASGFVLAGDIDPAPPVDPWVALLPSLDSTPMGWKHREWFLGDHGPQLFDTTGNIGPTVWADGRIVGGWAQRKDGEVVIKLLEDVGTDAAAAIEAAAENLASHIGPVRLAPRARVLSPLEKELSR
ncbi:MAG: winged helix DNA-binding domain-containing protein [Actinomycetota bacterium]